MDAISTVNLHRKSGQADEGKVGLLVADMVERWGQGDQVSALSYMSLHPELEKDQDAALRLIYEEYCLRQEHGEVIDTKEWIERFPQWRHDLTALFQCHHFLDDISPANAFSPPFPDAYTLVAELGRGGQGRVYLARQNTLDDRPVVLKISPRRGAEHLTLARLQHTGIVPLFAVEENADKDSRILCMPYFGGASLRQLLVEMYDQPAAQRTGKVLLAALDRFQAASPIQVPARGPARQFLAGASREQAIAWIGWCLADALHFAHERGYVHLDVKPANILLTAEGQPMLLDFHIAQPPLARGARPPFGIGGTEEYMSPEQRATIKAADIESPLPADVDGRSDIFSLGLVMVEALGCAVPKGPASRCQDLDLSDLVCSTGLRTILERCLAEKATDRYPTAGALAEDLRRHVLDLPLKGVPNRSLVERWRKWRRRRPAAFPLALMSAAILLAAASLVFFAFLHLRDLHRQAEQLLLDGQQQFHERRFAEAAATFQRGLELAQDTPADQLSGSLRSELTRARRAHLAEKIHALADAFRFHGSDTNVQGNLQELKGRWQDAWAQRKLLTGKAALDFTKPEQKRLRADLLDLALLWADLQVRLAAVDEKRVARQAALDLLNEADAEFGPSGVLAYQRQEYERALGAPRSAGPVLDAAALRPETAWEHYALGRILLSEGKLKQAEAFFRRSVELEPSGFWPTFYQGLCALERKDYTEAESSFRVAIALAPQAAACHYNRGLALLKLNRDQQARAAFDRAAELDAALQPPVAVPVGR